ncbi:hypothetical protein HETIRDRAFT_163000 [Heterobasidion irregulare TC 32-1]|uniref:Uncharacterized protein n=1 Tax=Heterobasidion irregulare (strain TC 32-1) TaxID=747525 RepID=W4JRS5_HETIT|nr:uncharacterized protein HETIRDRAFT_163000 [Heterobasidion irregulare TC 32-1]ETW76243.1 hypothetical protein HETIRDRAFT_163000 [Heterobasidion irregulare TC 32-1]
MQRVSPYCLAYNTMEYKARLWNVPLGGDWLQACMGTEQKIHNRTVERPDRCEDRGQNDVYWGYWRIGFDEPECITRWGETWDKGCVRLGVHGVEAPMWGQKYNDDWYQMCWTTPGHLPGISNDFGFPNDCQQRNEEGGGMIGVWEYHDGNCHL